MIVGVIPARYAATRLPGKPLVDLCGQSMIERVWRAASSCSELDRVLIATDDDRVGAEARRIGAEVVMTDAELPSGTDRCHAALASLLTAPEIVINIQGDEPLLQASVLTDLVRALREGRADVATPVSRIDQPHDLVDPNVVKVVMTSSRRALYFSRSPVPPASRLSIPMPTMVAVRTVVVSSWMPNWRAATDCEPKISARPTIRNSRPRSW